LSTTRGCERVLRLRLPLSRPDVISSDVGLHMGWSELCHRRLTLVRQHFQHSCCMKTESSISKLQPLQPVLANKCDEVLMQAGDGAGPITSGGGGYGSAVVSGVPEQLADRKGTFRSASCHLLTSIDIALHRPCRSRRSSGKPARFTKSRPIAAFLDGHVAPPQFPSRRPSGDGCATSGSRC